MSKDLLKIMAEEMNVHEIVFIVKGGEIHFWTSLGFNDKPDKFWFVKK